MHHLETLSQPQRPARHYAFIHLQRNDWNLLKQVGIPFFLPEKSALTTFYWNSFAYACDRNEKTLIHHPSGLLSAVFKTDDRQYAEKARNDMVSVGLENATDISRLLVTLKNCAEKKDVQETSRIHADILRKGLLGKSLHLGSSLVSVYAKCGALAKAREVLDALPARNAVAWNALISGYAQQKRGKDALLCFQKMQDEGFSPHPITYTVILKSCGDMRAIEQGERIHDEIVKKRLIGKDVLLGNSLIDMYARCGDLAKARQLLEQLPVRDEASWNTLISGYCRQGQGKQACGCFEQMKREGFSPNIITFICILKSCGSIGALEMGQQVHLEISSKRSFAMIIPLGNALADMYATCGALPKARDVLNELCARDVVSWTILMSGYAQHGHGEEALVCFQRMRIENIAPNPVTFSCILKACGCAASLEKGRQVHGEIMNEGILEGDIVLATSLVDMYARCGALVNAEQVCFQVTARDVACWNALISGYVQQGEGEEALHCFELMQREQLSPNPITLLSVLKACSLIGAAEQGMQAHNDVVNKGLLVTHGALGTALVDMYVRCNLLVEAWEVHETLPIRDVVSWNALISGHLQQDQAEDALKCFMCMQCEGLPPDIITLTCVVKACGSTGAIEKGEQIHHEIMGKGLLQKDLMLGNALVDMYTKCGFLARAQQVIDELPIRDVVTWSSLITGYAQQGQAEEALACFRLMQCDGLSPNAVTFLSVLNACNHSGLVDEGQIYFEEMSKEYGITPSLDHQACMVDLFGRAGYLEYAMAVIEKMGKCDYAPIWRSLLSACRKWANVKLGRLAFDRVIQLDGNNPANYICMATIYAKAGMKKEAEEIEAMRLNNAAIS